jgi:hypothetical protein
MPLARFVAFHVAAISGSFKRATLGSVTAASFLVKGRCKNMKTVALSGGSLQDQKLVVDGRVLPESRSWELSYRNPYSRIYANVWGASVGHLENATISELHAHFAQLNVDSDGTEEQGREKLTGWSFEPLEINLSLAPHQAAYPAKFNVETWAQPYGLSNLAFAIREYVEKHPELGFIYWQRTDQAILRGFGVAVQPQENTRLAELIALRNELAVLSREVEQALLSGGPSAVTAVFEFPAPIKSACEQYLLYFAQFLRDLGIEAEAELKEEAGRVLFSVTPV